jgi:hypothetical protein
MDVDSKLSELGLQPLGKTEYVPVTRDEVADLEDALGAPLPSDYKAFIMKYGKSLFSEEVRLRPIQLPPKHISDEGFLDLSSFYGSNADDDDLLSCLEALKGRMPETMVPIADDLWGNNFLLGVAGKDRNKVYLWDCDNELAAEDYVRKGLPVPDDLWYRNLTLVANSFTDFINRFEKAPAEE